ncbi:MAG: hypothetical protein PHT89_04355 [Lachnospiraceae bacterium]|nr:hypothetical protein [Lachnospiraceae bacterium]MDD3659936.1 hypothetical protein [Lachnospiraceae bacterium]
MLIQEVTPQMITEWKEIWNQYKDKLSPNRKSGQEVLDYLAMKYPLKELLDDRAMQVVIDNVIHNKVYAEKLPSGIIPFVRAFIIENTGIAKELYDNQDEIFKKVSIFVGIDLMSGFVHVEGSSLLWDELYAFQGLDEKDIQNYYSVAAYISCLKRFGLLNGTIE